MMNIICKKCESRINTGTRCFSCGFDNAEPFDDLAAPAKRRRSIPLIVFMSLFIVTNIILILIYAAVFSVEELHVIFKIIAVIGIGASVFDTVLCIFILRYKKWAFNIYIGLSVASAVLQLITSIANILPVAFRAFLLYAIFKNDYKYFE